MYIISRRFPPPRARVRERERLTTKSNSARVDVVDASVPARFAYPVPSPLLVLPPPQIVRVRARPRRGPIAAVGA